MTSTALSAATATAPAVSRRADRALWGLQILLALFYGVASAAPKLVAHSSATVTFDAIGWGDWLMYLTGVLELAGAVGLLVPRMVALAALGLVGVMLGAEVFTWVFLDGVNWATPLIAAALLGAVAYGRRRTLTVPRRH
ncbi:DoxX family protein [Streptomyces rubiginosohelvolus]|uniref:DoxX family protein n=1 Tax=Streptomyces rubiginosohelvolus TaxID=67362 RepID=UPI0037A21FB8